MEKSAGAAVSIGGGGGGGGASPEGAGGAARGAWPAEEQMSHETAQGESSARSLPKGAGRRRRHAHGGDRGAAALAGG